MKIQYTESFKKDFKKLPQIIQKKTIKAIKLLEVNTKHPSLRVKKVKGKIHPEYKEIYEGRIDLSYRFIFLIEKDTYTLLNCGNHDEFFR